MDRQARHIKLSIEIYRHRAIPVFQADVFYRGRRPGDAGIVDENIQAVVIRPEVMKEYFDLARIRYVGELAVAEGLAARKASTASRFTSQI